MKSQIKKIFALLVCVCLIFSVAVITTSAAESSATISFADKAQRTEYSTSAQVWEQNGIKVTNNKGGSTSNVADYAKPARFYKGSEVIIEYPAMTKIVIDSTNMDAKYVAWDKSFTDTNATATVADQVTTITFANPVDSFKFASMSAQCRANTITVYYEGAADTPAPTGPEYELVEAPAVGTAYKFGMIQGNVSATDVYYLKGGMNGYYMDTNNDAAEAIDVYLESADGGYYLYTMVDNAKTYINMVVSGTYVNGAYEAAASTVYTFDATSDTLIATVNGTTYWFGTRNDKTYTTVGPVKTEYNGFYCKLYAGKKAPAVDEDDNKEEEKDDTTTTGPVYELVEAPAAATAYKFGMIQGNVSATDVYYLKGGMNGFYMDTVADVASAIDVYLEETTGGYYLYTMVDNVKTYINMVVSGTHVNGAYEAAASTVYTFDATSKTITADVDGAPYWFGTRNDKTYTTVGPVKVEYEGFYCQFYAEKKAPVVEDGNKDDNTNKDDTPADANKDNNVNVNDATKPVPTTGESNSVVVTLMSIVALAVAATFVVTKFCKN